MTIKEFKRLEFLGDALLGYLCAELIMSDETLIKEQKAVVKDIVKNRVLGEIAKILNLEPHPHELGDQTVEGVLKLRKFIKPFANALEVKLYVIYKEQSMDGARQYFIENILANYKELNPLFNQRFHNAKLDRLFK